MPKDKSLDEQIEDILFESVVMLGTIDSGTITDLDRLIIDRQKAHNLLIDLIAKETKKAYTRGVTDYAIAHKETLDKMNPNPPQGETNGNT